MYFERYGNYIVKSIVKKIKEASHYSIKPDEATDIKNKEQFCYLHTLG